MAKIFNELEGRKFSVGWYGYKLYTRDMDEKGKAWDNNTKDVGERDIGIWCSITIYNTKWIKISKWKDQHKEIWNQAEKYTRRVHME